MSDSKKISSSNRQLKVGEMLRRSLVEVINHDLFDPLLENACLTISEVKVTPDLKQATVYVAPLFGKQIVQKDLLVHLKSLAPKLRFLVTKKVELRSSPELLFKFDTSFDEVAKIQNLLSK